MKFVQRKKVNIFVICKFLLLSKIAMRFISIVLPLIAKISFWLMTSKKKRVLFVTFVEFGIVQSARNHTGESLVKSLIWMKKPCNGWVSRSVLNVEKGSRKIRVAAIWNAKNAGLIFVGFAWKVLSMKEIASITWRMITEKKEELWESTINQI